MKRAHGVRNITWFLTEEGKSQVTFCEDYNDLTIRIYEVPSDTIIPIIMWLEKGLLPQ